MSSSARFLSAVDTSQFEATDSTRRSASVLATLEKLLDVSAVIAAVFVADAAYTLLEPDRAVYYSSSTIWLCAGSFAVLFVFLFDRHGGYLPCVSLLAIRETERILRVTLQAFSVALVAAYFLLVSPSRLALGLVLALVPLFVTLEKWETHRLLRRLRSKGYGTRRAVISGHRQCSSSDLHRTGRALPSLAWNRWHSSTRARGRRRRKFTSVPIIANTRLA